MHVSPNMMTKLGIGQGATRSRLVTWLAQPVRGVLRRLCFLVGDVIDTKLKEVSHEDKHVSPKIVLSRR